MFFNKNNLEKSGKCRTFVVVQVAPGWSGTPGVPGCSLNVPDLMR